MEYRAIATLSVLLSSLAVGQVMANGVKITPTVKLTQLYTDNLYISEDITQSEQITKLTAALHVSNQGTILESNLNYQYTRLEYNGNADLNRGFGDYDGQLLVKLLNNRWLTQLSTSRNRQQSSITQPSTSYTDTGKTEVTQYNVSSQINAQLDNFIDYNINWQLSQSQADSLLENEQTSLRDSQSQNVSIALSNGNYFKTSYWSLQATQSDIDYESEGGLTTSNQKFLNLQAEIGHDIAYDISFFGQYYDEEYDVGNTQLSQLKSSSYGAGLRWQPSARSYFKLAYNWSLDDLNSNFVSAMLLWQPSNRTSLTLSSSKRFFGDAYEAAFSHRHKRISTNISYNESITNFQSAVLSESTVGNFICPNTPNFTIDQCTFAQGESPSIGSGQQRIPVTGLTPELSNNTYLIKQVNASVSYQFRRANLTFNYINSRRTEVESSSKSERESLSLAASYSLGRNNALNFLSKHEEYSTLNKNINGLNYQQQNHKLSVSHNFSQTLNVNLSYNYRNSKSDTTSNNFTENRVYLSVNKEF